MVINYCDTLLHHTLYLNSFSFNDIINLVRRRIYKGWQFTNTNVPLKLVEKPDPVVKPGFVIIEVKAVDCVILMLQL